MSSESSPPTSAYAAFLAHLDRAKAANDQAIMTFAAYETAQYRLYLELKIALDIMPAAIHLPGDALQRFHEAVAAEQAFPCCGNGCSMPSNFAGVGLLVNTSGDMSSSHCCLALETALLP